MLVSKRWAVSRKAKYMFLLAFISVLLLLYHVRPVRNAILSPVFPKSWRAISTSDILMMNSMSRAHLPPNVTDLICTTTTEPLPKRTEAVSQTRLVDHSKATPDNQFFRGNEDYAGFLPALNREQRLDVIWLYLVLAKALNDAGVVFFFVDGSLLGAIRHAGAIPWDTDLDLTVNVKDWQTARRVLSCLSGFYLKTASTMHWKFFITSKPWPFIDVFFFMENEEYLWSLTNYEFKDLVYLKKNVFPLTTATYEGIQVPVPGQAKKVLQDEFGDMDICVPQNKNYVTGAYNKKVYIKCSLMADFYPLQTYS